MEGDMRETILTINGEEMRFSNIDNLKNYLQNELNNWQWMRDVRGLTSVANDLYNKFVLSHISPLMNRIQGDSVDSSNFVMQNTNFPYIKSNSEDGQLIARGRHAQGDVVGLFLIIYLYPDTPNLIIKTSSIKSFVENGQYSYEKAFALNLVMANVDFGNLICDARVGANDELVERFSQAVRESYSTLGNFENDVRLKLEDIDEVYEKRFSKIDHDLNRRIQKYKSLSSEVKADTSKKLSDAQQDLISAKEAYHDQVDLDASVQYWSSRLRNHTKAKYLWLLAVVCFMGITFFGLIGYYSYGAVSGLSNSLHTVSPSVVAETPDMSDIVPQKSANGLDETTTPAHASADKVLLGRTTSELSLAMADLVGAALALTLFGVLIRIGLRQFNSHSHCALDASERVTFVKTYLALLGEGKLKSDEDRRVILESLFRTSQPGVTSDIPFSSPIELILKTIGDKKG